MKDKKTVRRNILDHQAHFVHMGTQNNFMRAGAFAVSNQVAQNVRMGRQTQSLQLGGDFGTHRVLTAGHAV